MKNLVQFFRKPTPLAFSRFFHPEKVRSSPKIVIGNNPLILVVNDILTSCDEENHSGLTIIVPKFWLKNIHKDYYNLDWGQTPWALPGGMKKDFFTKFRAHPEDGPMTWIQIKELHDQAIENLKRMQVKVIEGMPRAILSDKEDKPVIHINGDEISVHNDAILCQPIQTPVVFSAEYGIQGKPHLNLYEKSRKMVPLSILLIGGGRSALRIAMDFPRHRIACIKSKKKPLPLWSSEKLPGNLQIFNSEDFASRLFTINSSQFEENIVTIRNQQGEPVFKGAFYYAAGRQEQMVCPENCIDRSINEDGGVPGDIPSTSLWEATQRWVNFAYNLGWMDESAWYPPGLAAREISTKLREEGIEAGERFYHNLLHEISKDSHSLSLPSVMHVPFLPARLIELYQQVYQATYPQSCQQNPAILRRLNAALQTWGAAPPEDRYQCLLGALVN